MMLPPVPIDDDAFTQAGELGLAYASLSPPMDAMRCPACGLIGLHLQGVASQRGQMVSLINQWGAGKEKRDVAPEPWTIVVVFLCACGARSGLILRQDGEFLRQSFLKLGE